jgi:outer membrane protein LpxR
MKTFAQGLIALMALTTAGTTLASEAAPARDGDLSSLEQAPFSERGYALQLDNDLFSGASRDQDYSWGGAFTYSSPHPGPLLKPLHSLRRQLDAGLAPRESDSHEFTPQQQATQIGILAMTPQTLKSSAPLYGDRPFANLIFVTSSQIRLLEGGDRARFSSFTFGMLGLHAAEEAHRFVHRALGDERPLGWDHQISSGGEPTARYVQAQQWLLTDPEAPRADAPEIKLTVQGSAGFITEGSVGLSARWGRIQSPWWAFTPELGDYTAAPVAPVSRFSSHSPAEIFAFAGFRLKARAYNALLQGQFRHSDVRVQGDDLAHTQAEAWAGIATAWSEYRITYAVHYASTEITSAPGDHGIIWAGINFEKTL